MEHFITVQITLINFNMTNSKHCFLNEKANCPVFTMPIITDIQLLDGRYHVLILCITVDFEKKEVIDYTIHNTLEEVQKKYKQLVSNSELIYYGSESSGEEYEEGNIPITVNQDFPEFLYRREIQYTSINQGFDFSEPPTKTREFYIPGYSKPYIHIGEGNYCVKAYSNKSSK